MIRLDILEFPCSKNPASVMLKYCKEGRIYSKFRNSITTNRMKELDRNLMKFLVSQLNKQDYISGPHIIQLPTLSKSSKHVQSLKIKERKLTHLQHSLLSLRGHQGRNFISISSVLFVFFQKQKCFLFFYFWDNYIEWSYTHYCKSEEPLQKQF